MLEQNLHYFVAWKGSEHWRPGKPQRRPSFVWTKKPAPERFPDVPARLHEIADDTLKKWIPTFRLFRDSFDWITIIELGQTFNCRATAQSATRSRASLHHVGEQPKQSWLESGNLYATVPFNGPTCVITEDGVESGRALPRFRCSYRECGQPARVMRSNENPFPWYNGAFCHYHSKVEREVVLGKVYESALPPDMMAHVQDILRNPDGMGAAEELATAKAITNQVLKSLMSQDEWQKNPKVGAFLVKMLAEVTDISEKQARIADKLESKLNYRQVLVLLSAAVELTLRAVGNNSDAKNILFGLLPELPWPAGVAKVNGAEGIIGSKGQLLLPKPPEEKELRVAADFEGLQTEPRGETPTVTQRELLEKEAGMPLWKSRLCGTIVRAAVGYEDVPEDSFRKWEAPKPAPGVPDDMFRAPKNEDIFEVM